MATYRKPARRQKPSNSDPYIDCLWWNAHQHPGMDAGKLLIGLIQEIERDSSVLSDNTRRLISAYEYGTMAADSVSGSPTRDFPLNEGDLYFNIARNFVETKAAKLCKSRIRPMVMTDGAGYLARRRSRMVDKAIEGEFQRCKIDEIRNDVVTDSLVTDHAVGVAKVYSVDGCIHIEHVPVEDIRFDHKEVRHRSPRSMFQVHVLDKYVACERFPEHREIIMLSAGAGQDEDNDTISAGRVRIWEAWHLPSSKNGKDGRHTIAVDMGTLLDEEWTRDRFPFAIYCPRPRRRTIWGLSMMRDLIGGQREHERLTKKFQEAHDTMGMSGFIASRDAQIDSREISNVPGLFIEYNGQNQPSTFTPQPVHSDQYGYRSSIVEQMSMVTGVSQLSAQSQLPAGLQQASGKALQIYEDFESERLSPEHQAQERWFIDLSWLIIHEAHDLCERDPGYTARYKEKGYYRKIKWKDVLRDLENFDITVYPVSQLAKSPAAKFAQLQELLQAQAITIEQFRRLYDLPDLESELNIDTADTDVIDMNLDMIVLEGANIQPEPFDDLKLLITRAGKFYQLCRQQQVPEDALERLRDFIESARLMLEDEAAKEEAKIAAAQASMGPATPDGMNPMAMQGALPPGAGASPPMPAS